MNIFIDTQDMEERYGEELYKEHLENQNKEMKEKINKAIDYIKQVNKYGILEDTYAKDLLDILEEK